MLAGSFDNTAPNLVALFQVSLIAHPLGVVAKVGALNPLDLAMLRRGGLPDGDTVHHRRYLIGLELGLSNLLPLTRQVRVFAIHRIGYLGKVLAGMGEVHLWGRLFWWTVFAAAFGYVEAAVVVYLRRATGMAPGLDYPAIFAARHAPFHSAGIFAEMRRQGALNIELGREVATLLLLFGAAWAAGHTHRERCGIFGYTFAVWDLTYYLYLVLWIDFPRGLQDIDIYFLIPIAWYGPAWFPVLVCMPLVLVGSVWLMRVPTRS